MQGAYDAIDVAAAESTMNDAVTDWKASKAAYESNNKYIEIYQNGCAFMGNGDNGTWADSTTVTADTSCLDQSLDFVTILLTGKTDAESGLKSTYDGHDL